MSAVPLDELLRKVGDKSVPLQERMASIFVLSCFLEKAKAEFEEAKKEIREAARPILLLGTSPVSVKGDGFLCQISAQRPELVVESPGEVVKALGAVAGELFEISTTVRPVPDFQARLRGMGDQTRAVVHAHVKTVERVPRVTFKTV